MTDFKKLLESAQRAADSGGTFDWTGTVKVGRVDFGEVATSGRADTLDFIKTMRAAIQETRGDPPPAATAAPTAAAPAGPLLSVQIASHIADLERRKLARDTVTESKHSLRVLLAVVGDIPINRIEADEIRAFWDAVRWLPASYSVKPQYRNLSIKEAIERGRIEDVPEPSRHTFNKHQQRLSAFFNSLVKTRALTATPLNGLGPEIETDTELDTGRPFTSDELRTIFAVTTYLPWAMKYPHRWWGPMLGLYSGARVTEVAQLHIEDIQQMKGVWGFFVLRASKVSATNGGGTSRKNGKKLKTRTSRRFVPFAMPIIEAGFLDFVEDMKAIGHPRLFPHLPAGTAADGKPNGAGYGRQLSRQFGKYLKDLGIEKGVAFHAFRHTLSTELAEADIDIEIIAKITGHAAVEKVPTLERHYIHIADLKTLPLRIAALEAFNPPVVLPKYVAGQFAAALADPSTLHP